MASAEVRRARDLTLQGVLASQARRQPDAPALDDGAKVWTYRELWREVGRVAAGFERSGLSRGDRVAVISENRLEYALTLLAAVEIGVTTAAVNYRLPPDRMQRNIQLVNPRIIFTSSRWQDAARELASYAEEPKVVTYDGTGLKSWASLIADQVYSFEPKEPVLAEDIATIMYTSGSTGEPKGVAISHSALVAREHLIRSELGITATDAFVGWAPMFHISSTDYLFTTMLAGGVFLIRERWDAEVIAADLERYEVGWLMLMPGLDTELISALGDRPIRGVRCVGAMADLVPTERLRALTDRLDAPYVNSFGMTEAGLAPGASTIRPTDDDPKPDLRKIPTRFCRWRVVDHEGSDVSVGEVGELLIQGPTLFSGYWGDPQATALAFRDGWYHTGDLVRELPDGGMVWVDRVAYMLKVGGENVYPAAIERILSEHPAVLEAVVVGRPDERLGAVPFAFIIPKAEVTPDELTAFAQHRLARYEMPRGYFLVEEHEVPRNVTGKIRRDVLTKQAADLETQQSPAAE